MLGQQLPPEIKKPALKTAGDIALELLYHGIATGNPFWLVQVGSQKFAVYSFTLAVPVQI